jgi:hypothetical protein
MPVRLTPGQSVYLHGWWTPLETLSWGDVVAKEAITFDRCRAANLSLAQLHALQPDGAEWVRHGGVGLRHAEDMAALWRLHPLADLRADLADLLALRPASAALRKMGVSYDDLVGVGMTPETMVLFGYTALGWASLGFRRSHLALFTDAQIHYVFGLTRAAAEHCFLEPGHAHFILQTAPPTMPPAATTTVPQDDPPQAATTPATAPPATASPATAPPPAETNRRARRARAAQARAGETIAA